MCLSKVKTTRLNKNLVDGDWIGDAKGRRVRGAQAFEGCTGNNVVERRGVVQTTLAWVGV